MKQEISVEAILSTLTAEQKQELIESLISERLKTTAMAEQNETKEEKIAESITPIKPSSRVNNDFSVTRETTRGGKETVRAKRNQWIDDGEDKDILTPGFEKTPRIRQFYKTETVECYVCHKQFNIDPKFIYGAFHRCNRCAGR
jgi:hypothetical protein